MQRRNSVTIIACASMVIVLIAFLGCGGGGGSSGTTAAPGSSSGTQAAATTVVSSGGGGAAETYKIGMLTELTGPLAVGGVETRDAAQLVVDSLNAAGGINGHQLQLIVEDDGSEPTKAATALTKLIRQDNVIAVLGPLFQTLEGSVRAITEREQVPQLLNNPTSPDVRAKGYKWSFNIPQSEIVVAGAILDILKDKGYTKVVAISDTEPLWQALMAQLKADAAAQGITVVTMSDTFQVQDIDMTPQVTKLKELAAKEKPQALVLVTNGMTAVAFLKNMKQLGVDLPVIGTHAFGIPPILMMSGNEVNGVVFPSGKVLAPEALDDADPQKAVLLAFKKAYQAKYNKEADMFASNGYDGMGILADALKVAGADKSKLRDAIEKTANYAGATGVFTYSATDHEGLTKRSLAVYEIKDKKFVFVKAIK